MAEADLQAASPFLAKPGSAMVAAAPLRSMASIALYNGDLSAALAALGGTLPLPGRQSCTDHVTYLWSGPANWLALADRDDPAFSANLAERLAGVAAVTDQSDGRFILQVQGPAARDALAKLLPIDLHPKVFTEDATAMTLAGHINVQIWRNAQGFELACFRSFAADLYEALVQACQEFQP